MYEFESISQEHKKKAVNLLNGLTGCVISDKSQSGHIFGSGKIQVSK